MTDTASATASSPALSSTSLSTIGQVAQTALSTVLSVLIDMGVGSSSVAATIIQDIIVILPIIVDEAPLLVKQVQSILTILQNSGKLTDAQLAIVQQLQAASDAGFDTAAAAWKAAQANPQQAAG